MMGGRQSRHKSTSPLAQRASAMDKLVYVL